MKLRAAAPYLVVYLLAALAIPLFFGASWFRPFPETNLYAGELGFSAGRAMANLQALAEGYPNRYVGTRADRLSALWVQARFQEIGLDARLEEFACLVRETSVRPDRLLTVPAASLTYTTTGYNVVASSPGKSSEAVVIGAHRDVSGSTQGAEDNASGTAAMIELARVLSKGDHYYTYIFVSYDGEEVGLRGSEAFVRSHGEMPVKLAISLDMTAWNLSNTVGFYPFVSARSASPLWTVALARNLSISKGLLLFYFGASSEDLRASTVTFWRVRAERLTSGVPTDTGPFVDRGIPSLGLIAIQAGPGGQGRYAPIHSYWDDLGQVSAAAMERTGKFAEQYVRSLELNSFTGVMNSRSYFVSGDTLLTPQAMTGFALYSCALAVSLAVLSWLEVPAVRAGAGQAPDGGSATGPGRATARWAAAARAFGRFLRSELPWIALTLGLALASAAFPVLIRSPLGGSLSLTWFNVLWGAITLGGALAIVLLRGRHLSRQDVSYYQVTAWQRLLLNVIYAAVFVTLTGLVNPFVALGATFFPLVFLGRVSFRAEGARLFWSMAAIAWSIVSTIGMRGRIPAAVFNPLTGRAKLADFLAITAWMMTAVYVLAVPRRGLRSENLPVS